MISMYQNPTTYNESITKWLPWWRLITHSTINTYTYFIHNPDGWVVRVVHCIGKPRNLFFGLTYQGKDIVFRFIIEYSSLMDFGNLWSLWLKTIVFFRWPTSLHFFSSYSQLRYLGEPLNVFQFHTYINIWMIGTLATSQNFTDKTLFLRYLLATLFQLMHTKGRGHSSPCIRLKTPYPINIFWGIWSHFISNVISLQLFLD